MQHSFKILRYDEEKNILQIKIDERLNMERIRTYYSDDLSNVTGELVCQTLGSLVLNRGLYIEVC